MFIGEFSHNIDEKGRLNVPAKFRRDLTAGVVVTRGLDRCLWMFPHSEWESLAGKLSRLPIGQRKSRAFARLMLAGAWDAIPDSQGRIMLPEYLRRYARLQKQVIVAGLYNRVEIWDAASWQQYKQQTEEDSDNIAEAMGELGI